MIIADAGPLIAAADADDKHHQVCAELVWQHQDELIVPATVVVEVSWHLERHLGLPARLPSSIPLPRTRSTSRKSKQPTTGARPNWSNSMPTFDWAPSTLP
jgi:predicted nucleic acid-binding protein